MKKVRFGWDVDADEGRYPMTGYLAEGEGFGGWPRVFVVKDLFDSIFADPVADDSMMEEVRDCALSDPREVDGVKVYELIDLLVVLHPEDSL